MPDGFSALFAWCLDGAFMSTLLLVRLLGGAAVATFLATCLMTIHRQRREFRARERRDLTATSLRVRASLAWYDRTIRALARLHGPGPRPDRMSSSPGERYSAPREQFPAADEEFGLIGEIRVFRLDNVEWKVCEYQSPVPPHQRRLIMLSQGACYQTAMYPAAWRVMDAEALLQQIPGASARHT
jgi:hypothetical protein